MPTTGTNFLTISKSLKINIMKTPKIIFTMCVTSPEIGNKPIIICDVFGAFNTQIWLEEKAELKLSLSKIYNTKSGVYAINNSDYKKYLEMRFNILDAHIVIVKSKM